MYLYSIYVPEINLVDYRPSVIAAAAALSSSSDAELSRKAMELKTSRISSWDSQDNVSLCKICCPFPNESLLILIVVS